MDFTTCSRDEIMKLTVSDLRAEAKSRGFRGYPKLLKQFLAKKRECEAEANLCKLERKDLQTICKERNIKYVAQMSKQEMIEVIKWNDEDSSVNVHPVVQKRETEYKLTHKDLQNICKERNIKYVTNMTKQEMIEVIKWNDEDSSVNVHPVVQKRETENKNKYRDNPEQREKARECSRKWRINNPEKAREYWLKWQESLFPQDIDY